MSLLKNFAPWIVFLVLTSVFDWQVGLAAGLVAEIVVIAMARRVDLLNGAMLAFFVVMTAVAFASPDSGIEKYVAVISTSWLGLVALTSLVIGKPFTLSYARAGVSPEIAKSPLFFKTNQIITSVWTAYFVVTAALGAILLATGVERGGRAVQILLLIGAIKFTVEYPKRVHARAQQRLAPAGS
jgi:hypothetical protein